MGGRITRRLSTSSPAVFTAYAMAASFATYFCMYAFRKPFSAAHYEGLKFAGTSVQLKTAFVISQILGYTASKYLGIKICPEVTRRRRPLMLIGLILCAQLALLLFALAPGNWKVLAIFLNGLPLGMVWGLVVWYLEGRRKSELLLAGLSCSFILASAEVKDVGRLLMRHGVGEFWMPFTTGLIFLPIFLVATWLLDQIPGPSQEDEAARVPREPMTAAARASFVRSFFWGLFPLLVVYFFLTAYRDFRDNFQVELFDQLGYANKSAIFSRSEVPVALGVMICLAALNLVKDNRRGLLAAHGLMIAGLLTMGLATLLLDTRVIGGLAWMILVGFGSYLAYVPFGSVLFDRMIASTGFAGTAVFAIYLADAIGYTGSVGVQLLKDLGDPGATRLAFFRTFTYLLSILGAATLLTAAAYFAVNRKPREHGRSKVATAPVVAAAQAAN